MRLLPYRVDQFLRPFAFRLAMLLIRPLRPSRRMSRLLLYGWNNDGFTEPEILYVTWVSCLRARSILECGSGITTVILGLVAQKTGARVYSLEHQPGWLDRVNKVLERYRLPNRAIHSPLREYDDFDWYTPVSGVFDLVICDGPPSSTTRGGRYGLLPVMGDQIQGTIILDDAARDVEQTNIERWRWEFGMTAVVCDKISTGAYAVVRRKSAAA